MNNARRSILRQAASLLSSASLMVSKVKDDEENSLDNMPENLQDSERCAKMEDVIELLEEAGNCIDSAIENINEAVS